MGDTKTYQLPSVSEAEATVKRLEGELKLARKTLTLAKMSAEHRAEHERPAGPKGAA
jgi:hypothetical protein